MANEGLGGKIATSRLIYAAEREEGRIAGEHDGKIKGKIEGKIEGTQNTLAKLIGLRFPTATPSFIKKVSRPTEESCVDKVMAFAPATSSLDEFKKIIKPLKPAY